MEIGPIGIWMPRRFGAQAAGEIEALGYGALWLGGSPSVDDARPFLEASSTMVVATGILNVWQQRPGRRGRCRGRAPRASRAASCSASASAIPRRRATTPGR